MPCHHRAEQKIRGRVKMAGNIRQKKRVTMRIEHVWFVSLLMSVCVAPDGCPLEESEALLAFKRSLNDEFDYLSSWKDGSDCCSWEGISCYGKPKHVSSVDLSGFKFSTSIDGHMDSFLFQLKHLRHLDLKGINLGMAREGLKNAFSSLSNLTYLGLSNCDLSGVMPAWLGNMSSLISLDLSVNSLSGQISPTLSKLVGLTYLDLSYNQLSGAIPFSLVNLSALTFLNLGSNQLNESIPSSLVLPSRLEYVDLSSNKMAGTFISETLLQNLTKLIALDLSSSGVSINITSAWIPLFQTLDTLDLTSCNIGGAIPNWISTQFFLRKLRLSDCNLVGHIPSWLWDFSSDLSYVNLSKNSLQGRIIPRPMTLEVLDLSMNHFSGHIPPDIDIFLSQVHPRELDGGNFQMVGADLRRALYLHDNNFTGQIPSSLGKLEYLSALDISNNYLRGLSLANCSHLWILNVANNQLEGKLPDEFSQLQSLLSLNLENNRFNGALPPSLQNCTELQLLNVENNALTGNIPTWIANLSELQVLVMKSNHFMGKIPSQIGSMAKLQLLDLASNRISGPIPESISDLPSMIDLQQNSSVLGENVTSSLEYFLYRINPSFVKRRTPAYHHYGLDITIKGKEWHYSNVFTAMICIDLSNNLLTGRLPSEIGKLKGLMSLNVSMNRLTGPIPNSLGNLSQLESLDLSTNYFSGRIPSELQTLSFLGFLNLSNNKLSGRIPRGGQMLTFNETSFSGNPDLHDPLHRNCSHLTACSPSSSNAVEGESEEEDDGWEFVWWDVGVGLSFGLGFAGVVSVLAIKSQWRRILFEAMDDFITMIFLRLSFFFKVRR
eukprot:Gb_16966 [translate_table: standard]